MKMIAWKKQSIGASGKKTAWEHGSIGASEQSTPAPRTPRPAPYSHFVTSSLHHSHFTTSSPRNHFVTLSHRPIALSSHRPAFTLTEMLVAIAILAILFTLLFIPMTEAFDNARRGRIMASLQNAADYALEIMTRELTQAVVVLPQERVHAQDHTYTYPTGRTILHRVGEPLNLLDEIDRLNLNNQPPTDEPNNSNAAPDNDTLSRIDFLVLAVQQDQITPRNWQQGYTVITYYVRRADPSRPFQYMEAAQPSNRRQIFRAQWRPDPQAPEPSPDNLQNPQLWRADDGWILEDFVLLQVPNPGQFINPMPRVQQLLSHNALTPPDVDVADLRFTVEGEPTQDPKGRRPQAVVIEMTLRKPTPGAKVTTAGESDVPSLFIRRRVKVVLPNVP